MTEKELTGLIREFRQIKPRKDWVVLTKERICGEEPARKWSSVFEVLPRLIFQYNKLAFASLILFVFLTTAFSFAQGSLPGDPTYILKRITEKSQALFVSETEKPVRNLELANKRLEELTIIAETNQVKKLAPALNEFQASISEATKNLERMNATNSAPSNIKGIVEKTQKIKENKQKIEALGVVVGDIENLDNAIAKQIEIQIKTWQGISLDEELSSLLEKSEKYYYQDKDYYQASQALEELWRLYNARVR